VGLVSDLSLEGWSIVDSNSNKQETIAWRNPSCVHTHFQTSLVPLDPLPMLSGASSSSVPHLPVAESKLLLKKTKTHPSPLSPKILFLSPQSLPHLDTWLGSWGKWEM
jgi:hypothetical protein